MSFVWSILEMSRARRRALVAELQQSSQTRRPTRYYSSDEVAKGPRAVPLFGSSPENFALDYVQVRSIPAPVMGVVKPGTPKVVVNNVQGRVSGPLMAGKAYVDPATSRVFKRTSGQTDQTPIGHGGGSPVTKWDGIVRSNVAKPTFQSSRKPRDQTAADRHEKDLRTWTYDFSV